MTVPPPKPFSVFPPYAKDFTCAHPNKQPKNKKTPQKVTPNFVPFPCHLAVRRHLFSFGTLGSSSSATPSNPAGSCSFFFFSWIFFSTPQCHSANGETGSSEKLLVTAHSAKDSCCPPSPLSSLFDFFLPPLSTFPRKIRIPPVFLLSALDPGIDPIFSCPLHWSPLPTGEIEQTLPYQLPSIFPSVNGPFLISCPLLGLLNLWEVTYPSRADGFFLMFQQTGYSLSTTPPHFFFSPRSPASR